MVIMGIKEEFEKDVHNADLGPYISDKCNQHLTLTESFVKGFKFLPCESRVSFMRYDNPFTISLENFAYHCKLPFRVRLMNRQRLSSNHSWLVFVTVRRGEWHKVE